MNLCIDIGNTSIAYSIWNGKKFASIQRIPTGEHEIEIPNINLLNSVAISSVVPNLTNYYSSYFNKIGFQPFVVTYDNCKINLDIAHPKEVGPDRICNAFGAHKKYGSPCIVIDFGLIIIGFSINAIKSIPEDPSVLYFGSSAFGFSFLTKTLIIKLV